MPIKMQSLCPMIQVYDMPTSVRFYRELLGFEIISTSPPRSTDDFGWCLLRKSDAALMLNTRYEFDSRPPVPDRARFAAHDDTSFFIGCPDVDAAYNYLRGKGVDVKEPKVTPYGMRQLYLTDPDGFGICFQWTA